METLAVQPGAGPQSTRSERGLSALRSDDFLRILTTELANQDPLEPTQTRDLIASVSQVRQIELSSQLTDRLTRLTDSQRLVGAATLVGKLVTARVLGPDGVPQTVEGVVSGVRFDSRGRLILELEDGQAVRADDVVRIASPDAPAEALASDVADDKTAATSRPRGLLSGLLDAVGL